MASMYLIEKVILKVTFLFYNNKYMKFNISPEKNLTNKKQAAKVEAAQREHASAVARHADYQAMQQKIDAPFGKTFATGGHINKKKEQNKGKVKHKGRGWE